MKPHFLPKMPSLPAGDRPRWRRVWRGLRRFTVYLPVVCLPVACLPVACLLMLCGLGIGLEGGSISSAWAQSASGEETSSEARPTSEEEAGSPAEGVSTAQAEEEEQAARVRVDVMVLRPQRVPIRESYQGYTEPNRRFRLRSQMSGRLLAVRFEEGERVDAGRLLVRIEDDDLHHARARAQSDLKLAQAEFRRESQLAQKNANARAKLDTIRAQRKQAELQVARYDFLLTQSQVTAPFSGWVTQRLVNPGEQVDRGHALAELVELDPLSVRVFVPAKAVRFLRVGSPVRIMLDLTEDRQAVREGKIAWIALEANDRQRRFEVEVQLANANERIRAGTAATVAVTLQTLRRQMVVPQGVVRRRSRDQAVPLYREGKVVLQEVRVGREVRLGQRAWTTVASGLKEGDMVIVAQYPATASLFEGLPVEIAEKARQPRRALAASGR